MEAHSKETAEAYDLIVVSSFGEKSPYFLRNCTTVGFTEQLDFRWVKKEKTKASITFAIAKGTEAVSLPQSPFGGIWIEDSLSSSALEGFIRAVLEDLSHRGIPFVKIIQPPRPYEQNLDLINYLLFKAGFQQESMVSHQFFMGKKKIKKLVQRENTKYLTKTKDLGLKIQSGPIQNFGFLQEIKIWNQSRGYDILFDESRLISQVSEFPERYFLISILKDGKAQAHTLGVKLVPDGMYYYLAATKPKSPIKNLGEMCLFQLFNLAADQKLNFIDLGSSDSDTGANHSLIFFKSRFSNDISNKVNWTLKLK
ncbi:hypothetical protein [Algoriphagus litoralis]|uniref:hypothetical protein n=1 Tax=Algoriphagus litoralis TaxID=2202829 RepID=UPI000DBA5AF4|nr:hypothetical protein [Algoriphagus litoralis]